MSLRQTKDECKSGQMIQQKDTNPHHNVLHLWASINKYLQNLICVHMVVVVYFWSIYIDWSKIKKENILFKKKTYSGFSTYFTQTRV